MLLLLPFLTLSIFAQGPNNSGTYYKNADGLKGKDLKTAMFNIIKSHMQLSYDYLWTAFKTTDKRADGKVWDMYSNVTNFTFGTDQAGDYTKEGDVYNREHSFPKNWFGGKVSPMYTDLGASRAHRWLRQQSPQQLSFRRNEWEEIQIGKRLQQVRLLHLPWLYGYRL